MRIPVALVLLAACGGSSSDKGGVAVEPASVTLADDCGTAGYMPPPPKPPPAAEEERRGEAASGAGQGRAFFSKERAGKGRAHTRAVGGAS